VFGTDIDTEWRSDWKWQRLLPHIASLQGKTVLDVGCGSGYHCWRMLGSGAQYVLGIDPSMRFQIQHRALQKFARSAQFDLVPIGIEDMPKAMRIFDTVFSMGVLYHRKDPLAHIKELKGLLMPGGQIVLETLIMDEKSVPSGIFTPKSRYAQMRNVWSITTINKTLELLQQAGFDNARCVDVNRTSLSEQRQTQWMSFHSLEQFLNRTNQTLTVEGYPAPTRGIFIAENSSK
jgi:tRNA (mo5U34)-methyltransferase